MPGNTGHEQTRQLTVWAYLIIYKNTYEEVRFTQALP